MNARKAFRARNAVAFEQEPKHTLSLFARQVHSLKRPFVGFSEGLRAFAAAETLVAVAVFAEPLALDTAVVAGHVDLDLSSGQVQNERGRQKSPAFGFGPRLALPVARNYRESDSKRSGPGWIRTSVSPFARQGLYPVELRGHKDSFLYSRHWRQSRPLIKRFPARCSTRDLGFAVLYQPRENGMDGRYRIGVPGNIETTDLKQPHQFRRLQGSARTRQYLPAGIGQPTQGIHPQQAAKQISQTPRRWSNHTFQACNCCLENRNLLIECVPLFDFRGEILTRFCQRRRVFISTRSNVHRKASLQW